MSDDIIALGFVEVRGFPAAIATADAMLKCAAVRLLRQLQRDPAQITLVVEGSLGACVAAVAAGRESADRMQALVSSHVLGRPDPDTGRLVTTLHERGSIPFDSTLTAPRLAQSAVNLDVITVVAGPAALENDVPEHALDAILLEVIGSVVGGCGAMMLIAKIGAPADEVRRRLNALRMAGTIRRKRGRYFLADAKEGDSQ